MYFQPDSGHIACLGRHRNFILYFARIRHVTNAPYYGASIIISPARQVCNHEGPNIAEGRTNGYELMRRVALRECRPSGDQMLLCRPGGCA